MRTKTIHLGRRPGPATLGTFIGTALLAGLVIASPRLPGTSSPTVQTLPASQPGSAGAIENDQTWPCVSTASDRRELAFSLRGKVAELLVEPGATVKAGDLLIRLDDAVQQQTVRLSELRAADTSAIDAAQSTLEYREKELAITQDTEQRGGTSGKDLRDAIYRRDQARIEFNAAKTQAEINRVSVLRDRARLAEMHIVCPIDGVVLDVHKRPGETVDELTTVVTVIRTDPLWLDVHVPTRRAMEIELGRRAEVTWQDVDGVEPMAGRVIYKSPAGDAGARRVLVRVEVPNPAGLPSGLHGDVLFSPSSTTSSHSPTTTHEPRARALGPQRHGPASPIADPSDGGASFGTGRGAA